MVSPSFMPCRGGAVLTAGRDLARRRDRARPDVTGGPETGPPVDRPAAAARVRYPELTISRRVGMASRFAGTVNAPDFPPDLDWLGTGRPLSLRDLRGKIVLLEFWTFC